MVEDTRRPIFHRGNHDIATVSELIDHDNACWDVHLVRATFCSEDAEEILSIPLCADTEDWIAWHFDAKGVFFVKSAYRV